MFFNSNTIFFKCVFQNLQKNQNETRKRTKFIQAIDCLKKNLEGLCFKNDSLDEICMQIQNEAKKKSPLSAGTFAKYQK